MPHFDSAKRFDISHFIDAGQVRVINPEILDVRIKARIQMMQMREKGKCHEFRIAFFSFENEMGQRIFFALINKRSAAAIGKRDSHP